MERCATTVYMLYMQAGSGDLDQGIAPAATKDTGLRSLQSWGAMPTSCR
jgi:hypothetical protein